MGPEHTEDDHDIADSKDTVECDLFALVHLQVPAQHGWERSSNEVLVNGQPSDSVLNATSLTCIVDRIPFATISAPSSRHSY